jgi:MFS family permease
MLGQLLAGFAIMAVITSLWTRRLSVGNTWERDTTLVLIFILTGTVLMSPILSAGSFSILHDLTGLYNLEQLFGFLLVVAGQILLCSTLLRRMVRNPEASRILKTQVIAPMFLTVPAALVFFFIGGAHRDSVPLLHTADMGPINGWMQAYWITTALSGLYLMGFAFRQLLFLREDRRHRPVADIYMVATMSGISVGVIGIATAAAGYTNTALSVLVTVAMAGWVGGLAFGASYSWRRKLQHFNTGDLQRNLDSLDELG